MGVDENHGLELGERSGGWYAGVGSSCHNLPLRCEVLQLREMCMLAIVNSDQFSYNLLEKREQPSLSVCTSTYERKTGSENNTQRKKAPNLRKVVGNIPPHPYI